MALYLRGWRLFRAQQLALMNADGYNLPRFGQPEFGRCPVALRKLIFSNVRNRVFAQSPRITDAKKTTRYRVKGGVGVLAGDYWV